jgi:hypothetical protein
VVAGFAPRVKVVRVLVQLAAAEPALAVARVRVAGASGCADFRGVSPPKRSTAANTASRSPGTGRWRAAGGGVGVAGGSRRPDARGGRVRVAVLRGVATDSRRR